MDINKLPKLFADDVVGGFSPEYFVMAIRSGENMTAYTLTPQHAKRLSQWLLHNVGEFEKQHGVIDAKWEPGLKSPIQISDISNPNGSSGKKKL